LEQVDLLRKVIEILEKSGVTYMLVGSIASGAYGEPRMTQDIDIVIELLPEEVDRLCDEFPAEEFCVSRQAALEAVRNRGTFNVIHPASGNRIDFMMARTDPWGRTQLSRRVKMRILPDQEGFAARPEDIIISKMIYYRQGGSEKHLRDITGILKVSGDELDKDDIARWAKSLGLTEIWCAILDRLAGQQNRL